MSLPFSAMPKDKDGWYLARHKSGRIIRISPWKVFGMVSLGDLPAAPGMGYLIESVYITCYNSAAGTCTNYGCDFSQDDVHREISVKIIPNAANVQNLTVDDIDILCDVNHSVWVVYDNAPTGGSIGMTYRIWEYR